jgi:hypothetical protein
VRLAEPQPNVARASPENDEPARDQNELSRCTIGEQKQMTSRVRQRVAGSDDASHRPEVAQSLFHVPAARWGEAPESPFSAIGVSENLGSNRNRTKALGADGISPDFSTLLEFLAWTGEGRAIKLTRREWDEIAVI